MSKRDDEAKPKHAALVVQTGGTYADLQAFSGAEVAVLMALVLARRLKREARLSNQTRANPEQPWHITVHSRTARSLEDRGLVNIRVTRSVSGYYLDGCVPELTPAGVEASAALAKATGEKP